jgi:hypothetical protein
MAQIADDLVDAIAIARMNDNACHERRIPPRTSLPAARELARRVVPVDDALVLIPYDDEFRGVPDQRPEALLVLDESFANAG